MTSLLGFKKSVEDIWPINKKRFLIRVDFNVTVKGKAIANDARLRAALPTIRHVIEKGGIAVLLSHNGCPKGIDARKVTSKSRDSILATWEAERGTSMTSYFASLTGSEKVDVLKRDGACTKLDPAKGTGKTVYFASLSFETKKSLLDDFTARQRRTSDRQYYEVETTLRPVAAHLQQALGVPVVFAPDALMASEVVRGLRPGEVCLLENLRFYSNETSASEEDRISMARMLATYGDFYVMDAFGSMHRTAASLTELPRIMQHGATGYLIESELKKIAPVVSHPSKPVTLVIGGNKVRDCIDSMEQVLHRVDKILLCGVVGLVFLRATGRKIGRSNFDEALLPLAKSLLDKAHQAGVKVFLPIDHVTSTSLDAKSPPNLTVDDNVPADHMALDIGPQTVALFTKEIRLSRTALWIGVAGAAETEPYHEGTVAIAKAMTQPNLYSVVGGRLTTSIVHNSGYTANISHVSTGGSVVLQALSTRVLASARVLTDRAGIETSSDYAVSVKDLFHMLRLFGGCSEKTLGTITKKVIRRTYTNGDVLISEGDRHACMWVIASGTVTLENSQGTVRKAERGDSIGMMRFLNNDRSEFTVTATSNLTTYILSSIMFEEMCGASPTFALEVARNLCATSTALPQQGRWMQVADNFERTPNPIGVYCRTAAFEKVNRAQRVTQFVTHVASSLITRAAFQELTLVDGAKAVASITGLHATYHPLLQLLLRTTSVTGDSNPLLRILLSLNAVLLSSWALSFASVTAAEHWARTTMSALCTQVVQAAIPGPRRGPSKLIGLLSAVAVSLAFSRHLKFAQKNAQSAVLFTVVFYVLQQPLALIVERAIETAGLQRSASSRKDF